MSSYFPNHSTLAALELTPQTYQNHLRQLGRSRLAGSFANMTGHDVPDMSYYTLEQLKQRSLAHDLESNLILRQYKAGRDDPTILNQTREIVARLPQHGSWNDATKEWYKGTVEAIGSDGLHFLRYLMGYAAAGSFIGGGVGLISKNWLKVGAGFVGGGLLIAGTQQILEPKIKSAAFARANRLDRLLDTTYNDIVQHPEGFR